MAYDLKSETGDIGWRAPQVYGQSQERIRTGEIGAYEGFRFIVSPRAAEFEPETLDPSLIEAA